VIVRAGKNAALPRAEGAPSGELPGQPAVAQMPSRSVVDGRGPATPRGRYPRAP
jgi:hypothetical protein